MGRSVVFEAGSAIVLASELRGMGGNLPDIYRAFGIEPRSTRWRSLDSFELQISRRSRRGSSAPIRAARPIRRVHAAVGAYAATNLSTREVRRPNRSPFATQT